MLLPEQVEIIRAFGFGLSQREVAETLDLSVDDLAHTIADVYVKLHSLEKRLAATKETYK